MTNYYYINVYKSPAGRIWYGQSSTSRLICNSVAITAISNGMKLLYRIKLSIK